MGFRTFGMPLCQKKMGKPMFGNPSLEKKWANQCSETLHWKKMGKPMFGNPSLKKNEQSNVRKSFIGKKTGKVTFLSALL